jgi:adenylate kinase
MVPGARLVLLGKQGAGKGTQCVRLAHHYVVPHISTGDMFRAAVRIGTEFGRKAKEFMDAGELVPDDVTVGVVRERLEQDDTRNRGFILDGFPRNVSQAEALDEYLSPFFLDLVIDIELPTEEAMRRLAERRTCSSCGAIYGTSLRPRYDWTCDNCGGKVVQRDDDTQAAIRRRLEIYETSTEPLIEFYMRRDRLAPIDGLGSPDDVFGRAVHAIDRRRGRGRLAVSK